MGYPEDPALDATTGAGCFAGFVEACCLPALLNGQSADGGWGYHRRSRSSVEATCWALMALRCIADEACGEAVLRGLRWLFQAQLPDGSWPALVGQGAGCWTTSLACLALHVQAQSPAAVSRGLGWLVAAWPSEGNLWRRLRSRFPGGSSVVRQDNSLRGWSWTPGTASWVEPTSYALILLRRVADELHPAGAQKRLRLAEAMLYDRMCPGGGWNSGNPQVYGVAGEPRVGPTAWALLALHPHSARTQNQSGVDWLQDTWGEIRGAASLSLAYLCLKAYGQPAPPLEPALWDLYERNQFLGNLLAFAWAAIALSGKPIFFEPRERETKGVGA
jgi:hypothetical protein